MDNSCDGFGIDYAMEPTWARTHLCSHAVIQGGLDPLLVVRGGSEMTSAASAYLKTFAGVPYVFNLGHGFTPQTPPENVAALVSHIRSGSWK